MASKLYSLVLIALCVEVIFARSILSRNETKHLPRESRYFEEHFNSTIECIRRQLTQGNPDAGLPPMDPLRSHKETRLNIDNKFLWTDLKLTDLVLEGLLSFETTSLNLSHLMKLDVDYHYKKIHLRTFYEGQINLLSMLTFSGQGIIDVVLTDVDIKTSTQYNMSPPLIADYNITMSLRRSKVKITGIMSEEWSRNFSILVSYLTTQLVNQFQDEISASISPMIMGFYDAQIGHLPFLDFLAIIADRNCPV